MTGYESKKAAARGKLAQDAFDEWWDSNLENLSPRNPCMTDSFEFWAWEGWHAALAQPAQEPVAHLCGPDENGLFGLPTEDKACKDCFPVYTTPPQRPWVGLTDKEIDAIYLQHHNQYDECESPNWGYERAIEAKLKEKNS